MNQQVRQAAMAIIGHIYQGQRPYTHVDLEDRHFYVYRSEDIGLDQHVLVLIGLLEAQTMSGAVTEFEGQPFGYDLGVIIYCMQEMDLEELRRKVNTAGFLHAFQHEWLHVLDRERTNGRIVAAPRRNAREDPVGHYNDPAEFNAYFHYMAKDIMAVINGAEFQKYFTGDWRTDLATMTKHPLIQRFVASLRPQRKNALMRRLYQLYARAAS